MKLFSNKNKKSKKSTAILISMLFITLLGAGMTYASTEGTSSERSSSESRLAQLKTVANSDRVVAESNQHASISTIELTGMPDDTGVIVDDDADSTSEVTTIKASENELFETKHEIAATTDDLKEFSQFVDTVPDYGGYIRYYNYNSQDASSSVLIYIPKENADKFLQDISEKYTMISDSMNTKNINSEYTKLEEELKRLEAEKASIESSLAKKPSDTSLKSQLSDIETSIASTKDSIAVYDTSKVYTEISLDIEKNLSFFEKIGMWFKSAGKMLILFVLFGAMIAALVGLVVIFVGFTKWVFRGGKKQIAMMGEKPETAEATE